jgi:hypothetical protein
MCDPRNQADSAQLAKYSKAVRLPTKLDKLIKTVRSLPDTIPASIKNTLENAGGTMGPLNIPNDIRRAMMKAPPDVQAAMLTDLQVAQTKLEIKKSMASAEVNNSELHKILNPYRNPPIPTVSNTPFNSPNTRAVDAYDKMIGKNLLAQELIAKNAPFNKAYLDAVGRMKDLPYPAPKDVRKEMGIETDQLTLLSRSLAKLIK